jgi:hypothetical protein
VRRLSLSRSPIYSEQLHERELQRIRRPREEQADAARTTTIIGIICALGAFAFIAGILAWGGHSHLS